MKKTSKTTTQRGTAAVKKATISCPLPGQIESRFRRKLGRHNMCLNLLQIASLSFEEDARKSGDETRYVRTMAKKYGFHSLHPEAVTLKAAQSSLVASHIAFIMSAGDVMCREVRSSPYIRRMKGDDTSLFNAINTGDFVKKTVALVAMSSLAPAKRELRQILDLTETTLEHPCFALVDFYRLVRNDELHAEGIIDGDPEEISRRPDISRIGDSYGFNGEHSTGLTAAEALVCSRAWQDVAKWLCRNMLNKEEQQIPELRRRFANLKGERRVAGARNFMAQAFLFSQAESDEMLAQLGW